MDISTTSQSEQPAAWLDLCANLMEFVFPDNVTHPWSAARLYAWSAYGPAVPNIRPVPSRASPPTVRTVSGLCAKTVVDLDCPGALTLRGGNRSFSPIILKHELQLLLKDTAKQFVVDVFSNSRVDSAALAATTISDHDFETLLQRAPPELVRALEFSVQELKELAVRALKWAEKRQNRRNVRGEQRAQTTASSLLTGLTSSQSAQRPISSERADTVDREQMFTVFSDVIFQERDRRIKALRTSCVRLEDVRRDVNVVRPKQNQIYNKSQPLPFTITRWESPVDVARGLHRSSAAISSVDNQKAATADIVQNIRLLRNDNPNARRPGQEGWDAYACIRKNDLSRTISKATF